MACKTMIICICQLGCTLFSYSKGLDLEGNPNLIGECGPILGRWRLVGPWSPGWRWSGPDPGLDLIKLRSKGGRKNRRGKEWGYHNKFQEKQKRWWDVFSKHAQTEKWQRERGRLLSWIGPINWGQKIRVLEKGGEKGRIDLGWRAMNRAIQLWKNRSGPKLGWGGGAQ